MLLPIAFTPTQWLAVPVITFGVYREATVGS